MSRVVAMKSKIKENSLTFPRKHGFDVSRVKNV